MKNKNRFTDELLATIHKDRILGIRAGKDSTHRVIGTYASDVHTGHSCASWTSSQSRQRRAFRSCMVPVYSTREISTHCVSRKIASAIQARVRVMRCRNNPVNARTNSKFQRDALSATAVSHSALHTVFQYLTARSAVGLNHAHSARRDLRHTRRPCCRKSSRTFDAG